MAPESFFSTALSVSIAEFSSVPAPIGRSFFTKNLPFAEEDLSMTIKLFCFFVFRVLTAMTAVLVQFQSVFQKFFIFTGKIIGVFTH